jgi:hypothetical protein
LTGNNTQKKLLPISAHVATIKEKIDMSIDLGEH